MRFLICDDDMLGRKKLAALLGPLGEVVAVEDGYRAVSAFKRARWDGEGFDYVFLDFEMPGISGLQTLTHLRKIEHDTPSAHLGRARIVMVTSHADADLVTGCIEAGCDDYIIKPYTRETLKQKVRAA